MKTPVLLMIFNRPDTTQLVFEAIRAARPERLFIGADGPRNDHPEDTELCRQARAVVEKADWDCRVETRFQKIIQVAVTDAANIPLGTLTFPLRDNTFVFADPQYDKIIEQMRTLTPMVKLKQFLRSHNKKKMMRNFLRRKFGK